ncbi:bifunctional glutamate N-acetyltransferase/amino-acid acetyltransferase ArgJ [Rubellicoccus peritrichatus]|uniref:Arginine biosynthesis bifunctional protein ArgJ n=1 Tax=Rubellicoccus peritrichatus TaxID=3080537 RepID=A0AAQ3LB70_9BACT|nr:bifunctional glutamate N-acetyltransferase/amino-acid acetyltransferase ArgJ [Puniceicoccus sp. CR14]WOO42087.1 bifunctional glutamate N-acetyltransferase/amino-acid acetyltransferase ArgJ [Puniceicoccus sp. CR14]
MTSDITITPHSPGIADVPGFHCAGVACDVRCNDDSRLDLALVYSKTPCTAAGVFTTNDIKAAPVVLDQELLAGGGDFHGIVINSGNANACTGTQGMADARAMLEKAEAVCGAPEKSFFVCSTGRIGRVLPMENVLRGIDEAATVLDDSAAQSKAAAEAILTSDTRSKTVTAQFDWEGETITVAGMAKGAGMIEPNMATMLAFIATDAKVSHALLSASLKSANTTSFNAITVDGDMSTNDTVLFLANGESGVEITSQNAELAELFIEAVKAVCKDLALKIAGDGERITKLVQVIVEGAKDVSSAEKVARAIGNSLLVKTSWYGSDPNWGRLLDAAGYARVGIIEEKIDLAYVPGIPMSGAFEGSVPALTQGQPQDDNLSQWKEIVSEKEFTIHLNLNLGSEKFTLYSTDLSEGYVDFNKSE